MTIKEKKDMRPLLVNFGVALALSFAGFLYSRLRIKRIKPSDSPRSPSLASDSDRKIDFGGRSRITEEPLAEMDLEPDTYDKPCIRVRLDSSSMNTSPSVRYSGGDKDGLLLPEFDQLVREFDVGTTNIPTSQNSDMKKFKIAKDPFAENIEREDYELEIENLQKKVRFLQEQERKLEIQLLEFQGLKEQEKGSMELKNRLKISNVEAKLLKIKIESLQVENKRLEAQIADYSKVVSELEAAKAKIRLLKKKVRHEAQQSKEQILDLSRRVAGLRDVEYEPSTSSSDVLSEMERIGDLEAEAEELRKSNEKLQKDNAELARKLDNVQMLATSVLEDSEKEELALEMVRLREENEHMTEEVDRLQADRCADAEELVYLRWVNACLRYELRNYQPPPGKTVARDLSKCLSPTSEAKAKQLIFEYANTEDVGKTPDIIDLHFDHWPSSQPSYLTDMEDSLTCTSVHRPNSKKVKFFAKLMKVIKGKSGHHNHRSGEASPIPRSASVDDYGRRFSLEYPRSVDASDDQRSESISPMLASSSQNSNNSSLDQHRISSFVEEDAKDTRSTARTSSRGSPRNRRNSSPLDCLESEQRKSEEEQKSELAKYAEALRGSRKMHKKCASAYL